ncbi:ArsR/SmtB family transcription factor [Chthonomonas calidirosea]|uniref:Transcriptional regulator, ArsR family n=1 Tax=Chthonomonas calidirosea (strain DSM 23976 / ICMP 18418 / T49) TaxID=1303518 RepID=S0EW37_CHTCT|nr:metalloregulator ArsR/SmtB family transcription factor [Chthonomonas calidirosea]CCW36073.1 transcriptional regulator, ArsR family [Chthonomonas calidirosea T49]CEK17370.1 transcriptional regulator, ArsR family [Chthonomonas calidirosea]CEK18414.1 transcriptional regulator, ArsR family [Chthonomonas calidirosea]
MECQADAAPETISEARLQQRLRLAKLCKALGHPARLQILQFLATVPTCFCGDIVKQLPLAQSTVSQHLKILKEAGWIQGEIEGPRTCYWLHQETLAEFKALVAELP